MKNEECMVNGITSEICKYTLKLKSELFCDTPARAVVNNMIGRNGIYRSDKCNGKGNRDNGRMRFFNLNAPLHTHEDFLLKTNSGHHEGDSPLANLNIEIVPHFPVDCIHCVSSGIMRGLMLER